MNMKNTKERVIKNSRHPLLTKFFLEMNKRVQSEGRLPYKRLETNYDRVGHKKIGQVIDRVMGDVLHSVIGEDWKGFEDKSLSQYLRVYEDSKRMSPNEIMV